MKYSANSVWENKDQYDIAVVVLDRGQPVGDGQGRAAMGQLFEALAYEDLGMAEDVVILPHFYTDYGYNGCLSPPRSRPR